MTAERWALVTSVFRAALDKPAGERAAFLDEACGGDESLRRNVERLLEGEAESSLASPVPELLDSGALEFVAGETLAQYRVEAKIGEGGMGAVYRCHDTRLQRKVALKVLPPERSADPERKRRLMREARAASALNHPNIITVHEIGSDRDVDFIAMEYVQGKRLDEVIPAKGLRPPQVLRYAVQAADALAQAHGAGILHRDLKPSNIMVSEEGRVKILDFGLAKVLEPADSSSSAIARDLTEEGAVVGTASYMSPEQAEGRKLDSRSDIFSFGSVLYEMATGRKPFRADSRLALLNKIVNEDPQPPGEIAPLPPDLEKLILRCLRKDASRRYQTMADLKVELVDLVTETSAPSAGIGAPRRKAIRSYALYAVAAAAAVLIAFVALRWFQRPPEAGPLRTVKFTFTPARLGRGGDTEIDAEVSISPDGKHITYVESQGGQLWVRDIDQEQARMVPGATSVYQVFWSPDSQSVGYAVGMRNLMRIPLQGGTPALITKLAGDFRRAAWSSDGETLVYCDTTGLYTLPGIGGTATRVIEHPHIEHPSFIDLPGGRRAFLFQALDPPQPRHGIYVQVAGEDRRRLVTYSASSNPYPAYSPTGHIVYVDGNGDSTAIWALPFSVSTLAVTGKPFQIAQHGSSPQVSRNGTLVFSDVPSGRLQLSWIDRSGKRLSTVGEPERRNGLALSPDGRRLAVEAGEGASKIWIYDLDRGIKTRFTADSGAELIGAWSSSGDEIAYTSTRGGNPDIYSKPSSGTGEAKQLVGTPNPEGAPDWSPDRRFLIYQTFSRETKRDLVYRERRNDGSLGDAVVFLQTPFDENSPRFSPDGRFVLYASNESGRSEIYARDFPKGTRQWQISANGGASPRWRRDGKEIFYVEGSRLMAVPVAMQPAFSPGAPAPLFEVRSVQPLYDVTADGKRFIVRERLLNEPPLSIHIVHNWFEEFRNARR